MKLVSFMVGAMVLAGSAQAAPSQDTAGQLQEADAQLARSNLAGAQSILQRIAMALTGASIPGHEAHVAVQAMVTALGAPPPSRAGLQEAMLQLKPSETTQSQGYQAGWRMGYADARAEHYSDHRPSHGDPAADPLYQGYEAGWATGSTPNY